MTVYCGFPLCDNEALTTPSGAVETVAVSEDPETVGLRPVCHPCREAYAVGAQYERFRVMRILQQGGLDDAARLIGGALDDPGLEKSEPEQIPREETE